ncbi:MAG: DUF99 family protein [Desulfurococcales archaeon]|nr:DUF99 family protein [Desulfurococcales archaeon]
MHSVIACDDGFVSKEKVGTTGFTIVGCVLYKGLNPIDVAFSPLRIDGLESSSIISALAVRLLEENHSNLDMECKPVILLDTIVFAGFNIVSLSLIKKLSGLDVVSFYNYQPNTGLLVKTVNEHLDFPKLRERLLSMQLQNLRAIRTSKGITYVVSTVDDLEFLENLIGYYQVYTRNPEPLRTAHMLTSSLSRLFR